MFFCEDPSSDPMFSPCTGECIAVLLCAAPHHHISWGSLELPPGNTGSLPRGAEPQAGVGFVCANWGGKVKVRPDVVGLGLAPSESLEGSA